MIQQLFEIIEDRKKDPVKGSYTCQLFEMGEDEILKKIGEVLYETYTPLYVFLPFQEGGLISGFHEYGRVENIEDVRGGVRIKGRLPGRLLARYKAFEVLEKATDPAESSEEQADDRLV
mgnify:CR=1 FL=1